MLEPVEELNAEKAIKLIGEMCHLSDTCYNCPMNSIRGEATCSEYRMTHPDEVLKVLQKYQLKNEESLETEWSWWVEIVNTKGHLLVHEEKLNQDEDIDTQAEEILKKYVSENEGKYYLIKEYRCTVRENENED